MTDKYSYERIGQSDRFRVWMNGDIHLADCPSEDAAILVVESLKIVDKVKKILGYDSASI